MKKRRLGFYTDSKNAEGLTVGGSDIYFKMIIENADFGNFDIYFFIPSKYCLRNEFLKIKNIKIIVYDEKKEAKETKKINGFYFSERIKSKISFRYFWYTFSPKFLKLFAGYLKYVLKFKRLFARYRLDILHSIEGGPEPAIIGAFFARVPIRIATYCVPPYTYSDKSLSGLVKRFFEQVTIFCASTAIVKSISAQDIWAKYLKVSSAKFLVIPNGVDLSIFDKYDDLLMIKKQREKFEINGKLVVGITARLDKQKGHSYLVKAAAEVIKMHKNIVFLCTGDGPIKKEIKKMVKKRGLDVFFKFLGFRNDVNKITWIYDIAVLSSVVPETFGWAIIEGMACRKPVIATSVGAIPEIVLNGVTGILTPKRDSHALSDAICKLIKNKSERIEMGIKGRIRVEKMFTKKQMLNKTYGLYNAKK